jgi:hypothetical protein
MSTFKCSLQDFNSNLWRYHFEVPDNIAHSFINGDNRRVIVSINDSETWNAALMKSGSCWFVLVNQQLVNKLGIGFGDAIVVSLEKDHSEYGHEMPEELQVLLDQDESGARYFHALTKGKQRSLIYIVNQVKSSDSRLKKALAIVHHLKEVSGKLDFKRLGKVIKYYNNLDKPY